MSRLRAFLERMIGRYYEGSDPPARYEEEAKLFGLNRPLGTVKEWKEFAILLSAKAYRDGYVRGLEHSARMPETEEEKREDEERHGWALSNSQEFVELLEHGDPNDPLRDFPPEARAEVFDQLGQVFGTHRVVIVESREEHEDDAS